jgi:hypothetical protein
MACRLARSEVTAGVRKATMMATDAAMMAALI